MSRRAVFILSLLAVLIGLAVAPWTISSPRLKDQIVRELRDGYGFEMVASGPTTLALLPVPRLKFTDVRLANSDGVALVSGAQLRGELRLLPLLAARLELTDLSLANAAIDVDIRPDGTTTWAEPVAKLRESARNPGGASPLKRLIVTDSRIAVVDGRSGRQTHLEKVNFVLRWPAPADSIDLTGHLRWRGETVNVALTDFVPAAVASGRSSPANLHLNGRHGDITLAGAVALADEPRFDGDLVAATPLLDGFLKWTSLAGQIPTSTRAFQVAGKVSLTAGEIALPQAQFSHGRERFDGAATLRLDGARPSLRATLAGESLDLSDLRPSAAKPWPTIDIAVLQQADVDLRLSASQIAFGNLRLRDVAGGLLTSADRIEMSLGRASLSDGTVKGRLSLARRPVDYDLKLQTSFSHVDVGSLLSALGHAKAVTGIAQGQAALEATGDTPGEILRTLSGKLGLVVRDGEASGLALGEQARRADPRATTASQAGRGRTTFQQAQFNLSVADGIAEIADGSLDSTIMHAALTGQVSLLDQTASVKAHITPPIDGPSEGPNLRLELSGPWDRLSIVPDASSLIPAASSER
jgi:AsmA protein